jgi:ABC-type nitrate/sulfonate/bicarbonate transport system substrate-binding protein
LLGALCLAIVGGVSLGAARGTTLASSPGKHARALTTVTFILNWLPNVEFDGLWMAQKFGWWQKAGLKLAFKPYANGVNPETDVPARGGDTFGFQSAAALAIAASKGVPDVSLYADTQESVFGLTVLKSSGITSLKQLKGRKVGYQPHELYVPETMLAYVGLTAGRDYTTVPVLFDLTQLTSKNVDAYLTFVTNEPIALSLQGIQSRTFPAASYGFHAYDDVMFTTSGLIHTNPALVRTVTSIVARGFKWAHSHPQQAAQYTVANYFPASTAGNGVTAAANLKQQKLEAQAFTPYSRDSTGQFRGLMSTGVWAALINTLYKYHEITKKPNAATVYTNSFNPYH